MTWKKGLSPVEPGGAAYYSTSCIVWRKDKAPLCKYIIARVLSGKSIRWQLWQWSETEGMYTSFPELMLRLRHTQEKADWLERKNERAGVRPDHSSPIEAAATLFAACFGQSEEERS